MAPRRNVCRRGARVHEGPHAPHQGYRQRPPLDGPRHRYRRGRGWRADRKLQQVRPGPVQAPGQDGRRRILLRHRRRHLPPVRYRPPDQGPGDRRHRCRGDVWHPRNWRRRLLNPRVRRPEGAGNGLRCLQRLGRRFRKGQPAKARRPRLPERPRPPGRCTAAPPRRRLRPARRRDQREEDDQAHVSQRLGPAVGDLSGAGHARLFPTLWVSNCAHPTPRTRPNSARSTTA